MTIQIADDVVVKMGKLAVLASRPVGLGMLNHDPDLTEEQIELKFLDSGPCIGLFIDYYRGRMVKFRAWKKEDGWEFPDSISHEYESWISQYPSYQALVDAARGQ